MKHSAWLTLALLANALIACNPSASTNGSGQAGAAPSAQIISGQYVGQINGMAGTANVSFEKVYDYVIMSGTVSTQVGSYTFTADIYGDSGFGEMQDTVKNERFHIKIDITPAGFNLTSNPQGPGTPSTYVFTKH